MDFDSNSHASRELTIPPTKNIHMFIHFMAQSSIQKYIIFSQDKIGDNNTSSDNKDANMAYIKNLISKRMGVFDTSETNQSFYIRSHCSIT